MCTTTSIVVRWRTDLSVNSQLRYGTNAAALEQSSSVAGARAEHEIKLVALSADTKYYYSVEASSGVLASGTNYFFVTAPSATKPLRIWVLGDSGRANQFAGTVRDSYIDFAQGRQTDLWLMLGDNAYAGYEAAVFDFYPEVLRNSCLWPALGNHDDSREHTDSFTLPTQGECGGVPSNSELYFSFNHGNIHFVVLNSERSDRSTNGPMLTWLRQDLAANDRDWLIAYWHHPPYTRGGLHDSDEETELIEMRQNAVPILEKHGVDLVLAGHTHAYERSFLLNGHYGLSTTLNASMKLNASSGRTNGTGAYTKGFGPNKGAVYVVAGCSSLGGDLVFQRHPAMYFSNGGIGSLILDVNGNRLDAVMLGETSTLIYDYFTIIKTGAPPPSLTIVRSTNDVLISWHAYDTPLQLQSAPWLAVSNSWSAATNGIIVSNNHHFVRVPVGSSNQFFRLRRQ